MVFPAIDSTLKTLVSIEIIGSIEQEVQISW